MTMALLYALNTVIVFMENGSAAFLVSGVFQSRYTGRRFALAVAVYLLVSLAGVYLLRDAPLIKICFVVLLLFGWTMAAFRAKALPAFFMALLWTSFIVVADTVMVSSYSVLFRDTTLDIMEDPKAYYLLIYVAKIFQFFCLILVRRLLRRGGGPGSAVWADWARVLFFPAAALVVGGLLARCLLIDPSLSGELLAATAVLLAADVLSVFLLNYLEKQEQALRENMLLRQNLKLEMEHVRSAQDAYAEQRRQTHVFHNQLSVLRGMAEDNAPGTALSQYLDRILSAERPAARYVDTHRPVADVVLSQKAALAREKDAALKLELDDLSKFPLPDEELVVVLANLLDNAVEACEKIPEPAGRRILLRMRVEAQASYLYIENTTAEPVRVSGNAVVTTKKDPLSHGYGLKNVCAMLERRGAIYAIDYRREDSVFRFSAQLLSTP